MEESENRFQRATFPPGMVQEPASAESRSGKTKEICIKIGNRQSTNTFHASTETTIYFVSAERSAHFSREARRWRVISQLTGQTVRSPQPETPAVDAVRNISAARGGRALNLDAGFDHQQRCHFSRGGGGVSKRKGRRV